VSDLGDDNHVSQVSLDDGRLLVGGCLLFGFPQLFDEAHGLALETPVDSAASSCVKNISQLVGAEVKESEVGKDTGQLKESRP